MTDPTPDSDVTVNLELSERAEGTMTMRPVGFRPYILLEVKDVTDDSLTIAIEVGGGTPASPVEDLALFLREVAEQLGGYTVTDEDAPDTTE